MGRLVFDSLCERKRGREREEAPQGKEREGGKEKGGQGVDMSSQ